MPRGGYRDNAGRKNQWNNSETKTIRVPLVFAERLLEIARILDSGGTLDIETKPKKGSFENIIESIKKKDFVTKSNPKPIDSATESENACPNCGASDWKIEGYRTLKSGERKQKRRCRSCDRIWSVSI